MPPPDPTNANARGQAGVRYYGAALVGTHVEDTTAVAERLLTRLERVHKCGRAWRADCPKPHRSRSTLSIAVGDTGAVLLKCWSGCTPAEVLDALGMELGDLFPKRLSRDMTPQERDAMREGARQAGWRAALTVLEREATILFVAIGMVLNREPLADADLTRLIEARERIADCRRALCGR